jgi:hypothetical protein
LNTIYFAEANRLFLLNCIRASEKYAHHLLDNAAIWFGISSGILLCRTLATDELAYSLLTIAAISSALHLFSLALRQSSLQTAYLPQQNKCQTA